MAESSKSVVIVPPKGSNYPTWKLQCCMVLMRERLWTIINGTEEAPEDADQLVKFNTCKDRALAIIVLSVEPLLLYLLGDPNYPVAVWNKLSSQFQKNMWANKLQLRRRLYTLTLKEDGSVQEHIKKLSEIFKELAIIGSPVEEEEQVVHLLASLPDSYSVLVTALEANAEVTKMEIVTKRLLHEARKQKDKDQHSHGGPTKALVSGKVLKCFHCKKPGHIKRNCRLLAVEIAKIKGSKSKWSYTKTDEATIGQHIDSKSNTLVVQQALQAGHGIGSWIVDSGAKCYMCSNKELFSELCPVAKKTTC